MDTSIREQVAGQRYLQPRKFMNRINAELSSTQARSSSANAVVACNSLKKFPGVFLQPFPAALGLLLIAFLVAVSGCGTAGKTKQQNREFFTSGSREADQRASQRMARHEQLTGSGEGAGEKDVKKPRLSETGATSGTNRPAQAEGKLSLFDRLGSEAGISNIVADFLPRALQDPRVNWDRKGVNNSHTLFHPGKSMSWNPTPQNVASLQTHMIQFLALATGGPTRYDGKEMKAAHEGLRIENAEFDAAVGDLKASLDKLKIPNREQKELLAIVESTRPLIVAKR